MNIQVDGIEEGQTPFYNFAGNAGIIVDDGDSYYEGEGRKAKEVAGKEKLLVPLSKISVDYLGFMYDTMKMHENVKQDAIIIIRKKAEFDEIGFAIF